MGILGDTGGYKGLYGVTGGYKGLQRVTGGYKGLQGIAGTFFVARTSLDTISWFILYKNQSSRNFQFLTKTIDKTLWKNANFVRF